MPFHLRRRWSRTAGAPILGTEESASVRRIENAATPSVAGQNAANQNAANRSIVVVSPAIALNIASWLGGPESTRYTRNVSKESHGQKLARWAKSGKAGSEPLPAATVIPIRDDRDGLEALMLRKNSKVAFGGMWVFPGGRIDPEDRDLDRPDDELATARRAAVREAREEAGLEISADVLLTYSHWTPPAITPRRFLTWFFLAPAPAGEVVIDNGEIHEHQWMRPADALERQRAGEIELAPPTWITLYELARWQSVSESLDAVRAREPERFATHITVEEDGPTAMWHGDAGYEASDADAPGARHRLRMHARGWSYERTS